MSLTGDLLAGLVSREWLCVCWLVSLTGEVVCVLVGVPDWRPVSGSCKQGLVVCVCVGWCP